MQGPDEKKMSRWENPGYKSSYEVGFKMTSSSEVTMEWRKLDSSWVNIWGIDLICQIDWRRKKCEDDLLVKAAQDEKEDPFCSIEGMKGRDSDFFE